MDSEKDTITFAPNVAEQVQPSVEDVVETPTHEQTQSTAAPQATQSQPVSPPPIPVQTTAQPITPATPIFTPKKEEKPITTIEAAESRANEVVAEVFGQAVVHTVVHDEIIQEKLLNTAQTVVENKAEVLANRAEKESKASFIDKHSDACFYFGYDDTTTSKFHVKMMAFWIFILNTIYIFTIGFFIVSPISFILRKLKVIIKKTWLAIILALLIYFLILATPILVNWLAGVIPKTPTSPPVL
jgi:hypothetical protein